MAPWLHPGLRLKRWLVLLIAGMTLISLSAGYFLRALYSMDFAFPHWVYVLTLQFLPREVRGGLLLLCGTGLTIIALLRLNRTLVAAVLPHRNARLVDLLYQKRQLQRGPKIVAIGGGTGLAILLSGLKRYTGNLTAIVTVADDGGSSGRLRRELRILPPGDFRQCIAALADVEPLMGRLLQYRFPRGSGLEGHNLGNLLIAAMADIAGNFELGLRELSRVLAVQGQILPSTLEDVALVAELGDKSQVYGESNMHRDHALGNVNLDCRAPIERVFLTPTSAGGYPEAVQVILEANIVVVGPGSLYTSILPNLLVKDVTRALVTSGAFKVFVCNVATEPGETDQYCAEDFLETVGKHVSGLLFDAVITNTRLDAQRPPYWHSDVVACKGRDVHGAELISADVVDQSNAIRHDPDRLARTITRAWIRYKRSARGIQAGGRHCGGVAGGPGASRAGGHLGQGA